jgi:hypothetical protein
VLIDKPRCAARRAIVAAISGKARQLRASRLSIASRATCAAARTRLPSCAGASPDTVGDIGSDTIRAMNAATIGTA